MPVNIADVKGIALGTWLFGGTGWRAKLSASDVSKIIARAYERGVRLIDTAPAYGLGLAEEFVGGAIREFRHHICVVTKCGLRWNSRGQFYHDNSPESLVADLEQSLKRLKTDYVDVLLVHWPDPNLDDSDIVTTLKVIQNSGKARDVGICNWPTTRIERMVESGLVRVLQDHCNLLVPLEDAYLSAVRKYKVHTMAYSPLEMGLLTGKFTQRPTIGKNDFRRFSPHFSAAHFDAAMAFIKALRSALPDETKSMTQFALKYAQTACDIAIVGARDIAQLDESLGAHQQTLSNEVMGVIRQLHQREIGQILKY